MHAAALPLLPGLRSTLAALPPQIRLDATLLPPPTTTMAPVAAPAPRIEPPPHRRTSEPPRLPNRAERMEAPVEPVVETVPMPSLDPTPILAASPAAEPSPRAVSVAPPPSRAAVQAAPAPATPPLDDLKRGFGDALARSLAAQRRYPRVAQMRGWQGTVEIEIEFLANGRMGSVAVVRSSGHDVLDEQALRMLEEAELPLRPDPLRERGFTLRVPIEFRLRG